MKPGKDRPVKERPTPKAKAREKDPEEDADYKPYLADLDLSGV